MVHNKPLVLSPIRAEQLTEIDLLIQSADIAHSMKTPERNGGKNSPSSVLSMPSVSLDLSFEQGSNRVRSTVVVSEEGTELLLEEMDNLSFTSSSSDIYQTPNKPNIDRAAYSLLDDADSTCTPTTPIKRVTPKTPSSVDTDVCCYGYRLGCFPNSGSGENLHLIRLQGQLDKFLSDPLQLDSLCSDWQLFGIAATSTQKSSPILSPQDVKQALRNRAFNITERRKKMDAIRRDLCPFNATPVRYKKSPSRLGTVRSFDITQHAPAIARGSKDKKQEAGLASFFKAGCLCNPGHVGESPAVIRTQVLNAVHEDTCYDSDPETFLRRPSRRLHSSTRLNSIRISLDYSAGREDLTNNKENLGYDHAGLVPSPKRHLHVDYTDDNTVRRMVQEFMNEKNTLIIHTKGPTDKSFSPNAVKAWFERGQHLSCNSVIQPRFMWQSIHRKKLSRSNMTVPKSGIASFDLIDVSRILAVDRVDRKQYPFAKALNCFLIKTMDETLLFETKSKSERERIVRTFKLLVARLGSKLIVGDQSFFDEYFISSTESGPGEVPYWLNTNDDD